MKEILKVEKLSHLYSRNWAIRDINFEVHGKGILGLLGSNGAGKSTTMNIVCGVLSPTSGNVFIDGIDIRKNPVEAKTRIGFLPQIAPLHMELTVDEYLINCGHLRLMPKGQIAGALKAVKEQCEITHVSNRLIRNLSGGYRQRVGIAQAIIHRPKLVVFDEPTNGLDPNQIIGVRELIKDIARERAVIFSSHILSEVQATCNDIIMIEAGKVVFSDSVQAFYNYIEPDSMIIHLNFPPGLHELLQLPGVSDAEFIMDNIIRIRFTDKTTIAQQIIEESQKRGWQLQELTFEKSSMDEVFAQLSKKHTAKQQTI